MTLIYYRLKMFDDVNRFKLMNVAIESYSEPDSQTHLVINN